MAGKNKQYAEQYAAYAMEQMRLYGIPASITLAQGILESSNGQSQLALKENNHFGIKATQTWIDSGGRYGFYTDDRPNEKFCSYDSVADSYTHHSQFLKANGRYASCFNLASDDYKGWAQGLDRAGYATAGKYAPSLISIIEQNGLQKYDRMVMEEMKTKDYSFPLGRNEFMLVTSPFGMRNDPLQPGTEKMHNGMDIRCDSEAVFATEKNGKVVEVNNNAQKSGGKSVTLEYQRKDGSKIRVYYGHLSSIEVKVGDTIHTGDRVGISGNTGTRITGPHLHLGVQQINDDGTSRDIDPAAYLAEIAQKGNIRLAAMHNGMDLLAKYKETDSQNVNAAITDTNLSTDEWMKKLLSSEDSGVALKGYGQDPVVELVMNLFSSLMVLAAQMDRKNEKEQKETATWSAVNHSIDLTSFVPFYKECSLTVSEDNKPTLVFDSGTSRYFHTLTASDMNRLNLVLSDTSLENGEKQQRVAALIRNIAIGNQMSQNYQQGISDQSQSDNLTIR